MSKILIHTEEIAHALGQTGQENLLIYKGSGIDISWPKIANWVYDSEMSHP